MKVTPGQQSWVIERDAPRSRGARDVSSLGSDSLPVLDVTYTEIDVPPPPVAAAIEARPPDDVAWNFRPALEYARTQSVWGRSPKGAHIDVRA